MGICTPKGSKSSTRKCWRSTSAAMSSMASGTTPYLLTNNRHEAVISRQTLRSARSRVRPTGETPADRPTSYLGVLSETERVLDVHPEIAHRALDLGMTQHRPQVAGGLVDSRRLR